MKSNWKTTLLVLTTVIAMVIGGGLASAEMCTGEVDTETKAFTRAFASGKKIAFLWQGFFGMVPRHVIVQNPEYVLDLVGADEGRLTVKCEVCKRNGRGTKIVKYNNNFTRNTEGKRIWYNGFNGADGRPCERIVSVFARVGSEGWTTADVDAGLTALEDPPGYPDYQPFRLSIRGERCYGDIICEEPED